MTSFSEDFSKLSKLILAKANTGSYNNKCKQMFEVIKMSNQVSAIKKISSQLNDRYRQFLVMDDAEPMGMPQEQRDYFLAQAL
ncbi:MAG TPA: hypothetical protein DDW71_11980, partial [Lactobacillus sp.]|nr:hypothetical protein [Lactobacillus sp.]